MFISGSVGMMVLLVANASAPRSVTLFLEAHNDMSQMFVEINHRRHSTSL